MDRRRGCELGNGRQLGWQQPTQRHNVRQRPLRQYQLRDNIATNNNIAAPSPLPLNSIVLTNPPAAYSITGNPITLNGNGGAGNVGFDLSAATQT